MNQLELMNKLEIILEDAHAAILATTDAEGKAHLRWMTPVVLKWRPGVFFAFTRPHTQKIIDIQSQNHVEWMFQNRALTEVINIGGRIQIHDNPALKNELLDILGPHLNVFWKVDLEHTEFVVLETIIQEVFYLQPMKGHSETITL